MSNKVFIATSLDGYIADKNNQIDWLHSIPNPEQSDMGFNDHMSTIDALVMGRNTFELVASFEGDWPYNKPVFVLSNTLSSIDNSLVGNASSKSVFLIKGELQQVIEQLHQQGHQNLYIDGGVTIQNFLEQDLIDEMIITTIPTLLGGGIPLFGELEKPLAFKCVETKQLIGAVCQSRYVRER